MALTTDPTGKPAPQGGFQDLGWYSGYQYYQGSFAPQPGMIHPQSPQAGAGQVVSQEVKVQSAAQQGVSLTSFDEYLKQVSATSLKPPVSVPYTSGANQSYLAGLSQEVANARKALEESLASQRAKTQAELEAAKAREQAALEQVRTLTTPFREELEKSERVRLGTETVLADQRKLLGELDQLLTEGNELIRQQKQVTGLAAIRNPRIQKTMEDVAARASVINAVVNLQNTYLANAYQSIDRSIGAITQDRTERLNYYETVLSLANRDIVTLTADDRKLAEEQINLLKSDLEQAQKTANYIKELMVNPDTALALAQAGVTLNDTVEQINAKLADYQYAQEVRETANKFTLQGAVLVTDPKSVPADQLVSFTDSRGKTYYYKMPKTSSITIPTIPSDTGISATGDRWRIISPQPTTTQTNLNTLAPNFTPTQGYGAIVSYNGLLWIYTPSGWVSF